MTENRLNEVNQFIKLNLVITKQQNLKNLKNFFQN
jgi:hypothetical protein